MIVLDGAMGTELARRGVATLGPDGSARALEEAPTLVLEVHRESAEAGAMVLTANTFGLRPDDPRLEARAQTATALARQALAGRPGRVAGSVGPLGVRGVTGDAASRGYARLARALVDAGCDLVILETQIDVDDARRAAVATRTALGATRRPVPLWLSLACRPDGRTLGGGDPASLPPSLADAWLVGCTAIEALPAALARLPGEPWGVVPSTGAHVGEGFEADAISVADVAAAAVDATRHGATIVGGCCGTTPEYVRQVVAAVHGDAAARAVAHALLQRLIPQRERRS